MLVALAALIAAPASVRAHDVSYAHVALDWSRDRVDVSLVVHQDDAAFVLRVPVPEWLLREDVLARAGPALHDSLAGRLRIVAGGETLAWRLTSARRDPRGRGVELLGMAPLTEPGDRGRSPASIEVYGPVFPQLATHQTFVTVRRDGALVAEDVLTATHHVTRAYAGGSAGTFAVLRTFVPAGVQHIAIGPDHILFVLGLLLLGGGVAALLKVVTAFTLAHSLTLTLAALGLVRLPSRVVEPVIALSIVAAPLAWLARASVPAHRHAVTFAAVGIAAAGGYWFVERLLRG